MTLKTGPGQHHGLLNSRQKLALVRRFRHFLSARLVNARVSKNISGLSPVVLSERLSIFPIELEEYVWYRKIDKRLRLLFVPCRTICKTYVSFENSHWGLA